MVCLNREFKTPAAELICIVIFTYETQNQTCQIDAKSVVSAQNAQNHKVGTSPEMKSGSRRLRKKNVVSPGLKLVLQPMFVFFHDFPFHMACQKCFWNPRERLRVTLMIVTTLPQSHELLDANLLHSWVLQTASRACCLPCMYFVLHLPINKLLLLHMPFISGADCPLRKPTSQPPDADMKKCHLEIFCMKGGVESQEQSQYCNLHGL